MIFMMGGFVMYAENGFRNEGQYYAVMARARRASAEELQEVRRAWDWDDEFKVWVTDMSVLEVAGLVREPKGLSFKTTHPATGRVVELKWRNGLYEGRGVMVFND